MRTPPGFTMSKTAYLVFLLVLLALVASETSALDRSVGQVRAVDPGGSSLVVIVVVVVFVALSSRPLGRTESSRRLPRTPFSWFCALSLEMILLSHSLPAACPSSSSFEGMARL
jgi:hypothetical protein